MITKTCAVSGKKFVVTDKDRVIYEKFKVSVPDLCPDEILRGLMAHRNERTLHHRKCDFTGKSFVSAYPDKTSFPVYDNESWWGDAWDPLEYGRDFDFDRPFFDQFRDLQQVVPREGTSVFNSENADFNSHVRESKNCYLNSLAFLCEDIYYTYWTVKTKDCMDSSFLDSCTLCYDCFNLENCYECVRVQDSENCTNCYFSYGLKNCKNCIGCANLNYKEYHVFDKPVSKEEFERVKEKILNGCYSTYLQGLEFFDKTTKSCIHKYLNVLQSENVSGDYILKSKNIDNCYDVRDSEDCAHCLSLSSAKDAYHSVSCGWPNGELIYMSAVTRGCTNLRFCYYCWFSQNLDYCDGCSSCKNCFGCIGLKQKEYCILNKQYSKEEYEALVPQIIEHMKLDPGSKSGTGSVQGAEWGKFFPPSLALFPYNESQSQEYYPLDQAGAEKLGYKWQEAKQSTKYAGPKVVLPDSLAEVNASVLEKILTCQTCDKNYRIIGPELKFHQNLKTPLPPACPDCRHRERMNLRNPRHCWDRECSQCQKPIKTSFSPDRLETVYCEKCYLAAVVT